MENFLFNGILPFLFLVAYVFLIGIVMYTGFNLKLVTGGMIWGIPVQASLKQQKVRKRSLILLIVALALLVALFVTAFSTFVSLLISHFIMALVIVILFFTAFIVGTNTANKRAMQRLEDRTENNAMVLDTLPIMQNVATQIDRAAYFVVSFEGIALFNDANYCYAIERYEDYQLGELTTPAEVALVGMYFVQKYGDRFSFKVDMAVIPGTPGEVHTSIGLNGVHVQYTRGTRDKHLFRSYIFTRR